MQLFCYLRGVLFYIRNFDFDNFRNLVQILFKSYSKNWKNFLIKYNVKFLKPPVICNFEIQKSVTQNFNFCSRFRSDLP